MSTASFDGAGVDAQAALVASGHAFSVSDAREPDFPLSWVNPAFTELTGYEMDEVVGRNCRFLKGPDTDPATAARIAASLVAGVTVSETVLNYRKDGSSWWNRVIITPVFARDGELTHFVGVQSNADAHVLASQQRDEARYAVSQADAKQHAAEHAMAVALQRSLLPELPDLPGLQLAARYLPAAERAEVGGDWYDVLPLPDGSTGIAIGDVMGHDLHAAASMGQLRSVLRSYAWEGYGPAEVIDRLNQLVCALGMAQLATCVYARFEPGQGAAPNTLRWCNAGHLPPMLRTPDGAVHVLSEASSVLIGVPTRTHARLAPRTDGSRAVPAGSTLLLYTDGLIETRSRAIDDSIELLRATFAGIDPEAPVQDVADRVVAACAGTGHDDDTCLLVVRVE